MIQSQVDGLNKVVNGLNPSKGKTTSQIGINLIISFEDLELDAYDDGISVWTIGYGTTVYPNGVRVKSGDTCTLAQAKSYFAHDLNCFEKAVNQRVKISINQNQFDALVSLTYNIGEQAFKDSILLTKLNKGDCIGAVEQFPSWNKVGGQIMKGLARRRAAERELFLKK